MIMSAPRSQRSLLDIWSALGLMLATGGAFAALFPLSRARETHALSAAPDMLALSYLNLALSRAPSDQALRLRVAERTLEAGQFDRARALLAPLPSGHAGAARLGVEIDYRAWAAVDPDDERLRAIALARLTASIEHTDSRRLATDDAERLAWVAAQVGLGSQHARILDEVARRDLGDDERLRAADAAWLELNDPLSAARLRAARALALPQQNGRVHASLALRRALASGQPGPALVLFRQLRPRYGNDARVLELGLAALAGVDDVEALAVARALLELRPDDAALRQRIAALDAWTRGAPNVPEAAAYPRQPLARPAALRWDGSDADAALAAAGIGADGASAQAAELAALFESLGAPEQALARLDAALAGEGVDEPALWDLKLGVLLRLGDRRGALATLEQMDARFGATEASLRRRAELLLALGELRAALELLDSAPGPRAVADARRITAIGWELGDVPRVRDAYRVIAASSEATSDDVRRLWLLERDNDDASAGARAALAGYQRFGDSELLSLALHAALESHDDALVEAVLEAGERAGARVSDAESLRLQVGVRQQRAYRALLANRPARARAELARSARLLEQARTRATAGEASGELWQTQERQTLNVALAQNDHRLLARVYPEQAEKLTARERVFVLHRLGRDEEAVDTALASLDEGTLPERDTSALEADADALGAGMPRQLGVLFDVQTLAGLRAVRAGALARSSWSGGRSLAARAEITRLAAGNAATLSLTGQDELAAEIGAGLGQSRLNVGVVALDGRDPRPSLRFEQGLRFELGQRAERADGADAARESGEPAADAAEPSRAAYEALDLELIARVNERSHDTPLLRVLGVEDELSARASLAFAGRYSATLRGSAKLYSLRSDRDYLGAGATLDAAVGRSWPLPGGIGDANLRAAGYVAPRFAALDAAASLVPDGASWVGLGAGFARGQLALAPVAGRRLSVLVDATAGWLLPLDELGWSGQLGLGISVLGADQLSISASASNVVSSVPGFAVYTLGADYRVSSW